MHEVSHQKGNIFVVVVMHSLQLSHKPCFNQLSRSFLYLFFIHWSKCMWDAWTGFSHGSFREIQWLHDHFILHGRDMAWWIRDKSATICELACNCQKDLLTALFEDNHDVFSCHAVVANNLSAVAGHEIPCSSSNVIFIIVQYSIYHEILVVMVLHFFSQIKLK